MPVYLFLYKHLDNIHMLFHVFFLLPQDYVFRIVTLDLWDHLLCRHCYIRVNPPPPEDGLVKGLIGISSYKIKRKNDT